MASYVLVAMYFNTYSHMHIGSAIMKIIITNIDHNNNNNRKREVLTQIARGSRGQGKPLVHKPGRVYVITKIDFQVYDLHRQA